MTKTEVRYTWEWFREWVEEKHPALLAELPEDGCTPEFLRFTGQHKLLGEVITDVRSATDGDVAWFICLARQDRWWPEDTFVEDVHNAPGEVAWAISCAHYHGLWREDTFVADVRNAPGDVAGAIAYARIAGLWPEDE